MPTSIVSPVGTVTKLTPDAAGQLQRVEDPAGGAIQLGYTSGLLTSFTDGNAQVHKFSYDPDGRLNTDTSADTGYKKLVLNDAGDHWTVASTSALGATTSHDVRYDGTGTTTTLTFSDGTSNRRVEGVDARTTSTAADGTTTVSVDSPDARFGYSSPVRSTTVTTPGGIVQTVVQTRSTTLSDLTNPFSVTSSVEAIIINDGSGSTLATLSSSYDVSTHTRTTVRGGLSITEVLDGAGRLVTRYVPGLAPVSITYDPFGRMRKLAQSGRIAGFDYGADGFLSAVTDPLGNVTSYVHDAAGRIASQRLPTGESIQVAFDAAGNAKSVTPPGRTAHLMTYDPDDRIASYLAPPVGTEPSLTAYNYDLEGKRTHVEYPDGSSLTYAYDPFQRALTVTHPLDSVTYGYDSDGRVASLTTPVESLSFAYDGALLTALTRSGPVAGRVSYSYDAAYRPSAITLNADSPIAYGYDTGGRLLTAGALALTRDPGNGLVTGVRLGALSESKLYNEYGEVASYNVRHFISLLYGLTLDRDLAGRIRTKTETIDGVTTTQLFGYDSDGHLTDVTVNGVLTSHYDFDTNGNRAGRSGSAGSVAATYDEQDRIKAYGGTTYAYTPNGALKSKVGAVGSTAYVYDLLGNLRAVTLPSGAAVEYVIDGQNRRVGKKIAGTLVQGFLYGRGLGPLAELDNSGATVATFVYATKPNVPDYLVKAGKNYRVVTDQVGSVRLVVDAASGTVAQRIDYDEFGIVTNDSNPGFQPFGFAGGLYDRDTGLVRFGARDYDAETGRWTGKDPARFGGGGTNLYAYVGSDATTLGDATGLAVYRCSRPLQGPLGFLFDHVWLMTSTKSAGIMPDDWNLAVWSDDSLSSVSSHTVCEEQPGVSEQCVDDSTPFGRPNGPYIPLINDCNTSASNVLTACGPVQPAWWVGWLLP
jgi:RHS repeat-associated protein